MIDMVGAFKGHAHCRTCLSTFKLDADVLSIFCISILIVIRRICYEHVSHNAVVREIGYLEQFCMVCGERIRCID